LLNGEQHIVVRTIFSLWWWRWW